MGKKKQLESEFSNLCKLFMHLDAQAEKVYLYTATNEGNVRRGAL